MQIEEEIEILYGPDVSPDQEEKYNNLQELFSHYTNLITQKRKKALKVILDKEMPAFRKRAELKEYFDFRLEMGRTELSNGKSYSIDDLYRLADLLFKDESFHYGQNYLVINSLNFFENHVNYYDIFLAYHFHRLSKTEESLSHLVQMLAYYCSGALTKDGRRIELIETYSKLQNEESIELLYRIIAAVDACIAALDGKLDAFKAKYVLLEGNRFDNDSTIDGVASREYLYEAINVHISHLLQTLLYYRCFKETDISYVTRVLDMLYKDFACKNDVDIEKWTTNDYPHLTDLYEVITTTIDELDSREEAKLAQELLERLERVESRLGSDECNKWFIISREEMKKAVENITVVDTYSQIDRLALQSFAKADVVELHVSHLLEKLVTYGRLKETDLFYLERMLNELYRVFFTKNDSDIEEWTENDYPRLEDLFDIIRTKISGSQSKREKAFAEEIYKMLKDVENILYDDDCDKWFILSKDELELLKTVEFEAEFDNIANCIRGLFLTNMVIEMLNEQGVITVDEDELNNRAAKCRIICSTIFEESTAFEQVSKGAVSSKLITLITAEEEKEEQRSSLFKAHLEVFADKLSVNDLLTKRLILMNQAKALDPSDESFLTKCSNEISNKLIQLLKNDIVPYKTTFNNQLNKKAKVFSDDVIDALATAEMLYDQYGNVKHDQDGFDYSGISALYYQAVETAYYELIWIDYANYLNTLPVGNSTFIDELRKGNAPAGYLPIDYSHYVERRKKWIKQVKLDCTYGTFSNFVNKESEVPKYKDWLAKKLGFSDYSDMNNKTSVRQDYSLLGIILNRTSGFRNNACHGCHKILLNQCQTDKEYVYSSSSKQINYKMGILDLLEQIFSNTNH